MQEAGVIIVSDPGSDKVLVESPTLQCVHCQKHWVPRPGSGNVRGFCMRCNGPVCGLKCAECIPAEKQLEIMEGACDPTAITVAVPEDIKKYA